MFFLPISLIKAPFLQFKNNTSSQIVKIQLRPFCLVKFFSSKFLLDLLLSGLDKVKMACVVQVLKWRQYFFEHTALSENTLNTLPRYVMQYLSPNTGFLLESPFAYAQWNVSVIRSFLSCLYYDSTEILVKKY